MTNKTGVKSFDVANEILQAYSASYHKIYRYVPVGELHRFLLEYTERMDLSEPCPDPVVEQTVTLLRSRSVVGVAKYGTTLADNKLTRKQWMQHLLEELLDAANYIQADMQQDNENEKAMGLEYAKGFRDGWQEKRDRLSGKSVSTCGVLAQKSAHEFTSYDRQISVAAAYRLRHFYNSEWAGTPWRIENGKIVYGNAELQPAICKINHDIYKTGDKDAPESILDRNGEVALAMCRNCKQAEADLVDPCEPNLNPAVQHHPV